MSTDMLLASSPHPLLTYSSEVLSCVLGCFFIFLGCVKRRIDEVICSQIHTHTKKVSHF